MKCVIPEISWHNRDPVLSVDFQPFGNGECYRLATGGTDTHVLIWLARIDVKGGASLEFVSDLKRHNRAVNVVRFSPSGELLASGDDEAAIWLWKQQDQQGRDVGGDLFVDDDEKENKENWNPIRNLRGHIEDVYDLCWSPNSNFLVSGSVDNSAIIWDIGKGRSVGLLSDHKGFVQGVAWDPQDQYVATLCSDRVCRIYNIASKRVVHKLYKANLSTTTTTTTTTTPTKTAALVARLGNDPIESTTPPKASRLFHDDTLKSFFRRLVFTPDGELLITPAGIVEVDDGHVLNVTHVFSRHSFAKPAFYLPSKDKHTLAVRCCPTFFKLRPVKGKPIDGDLGRRSQPWELSSTMLKLPYRMVFAIATQDSVLFYDTQQPMPFAKVANIQYTRLSDLSWSSDGRVLIVSSTDGYCSLVTFDENELGVAYQEDMPPAKITPDVTVVSPEMNVCTSAKSYSETKRDAALNVSPSTSTGKSEMATPIASSSQEPTSVRKRVSLITLFSPKSTNKDGLSKLARSPMTSVEKGVTKSADESLTPTGNDVTPTPSNDDREPLSMDVVDVDDVIASEKHVLCSPCDNHVDPAELIINVIECETSGDSVCDVATSDRMETECVTVIADASAIPSANNVDDSKPSSSSDNRLCSALPVSVTSATSRQPRRVQLITLSTTPKTKKDTME